MPTVDPTLSQQGLATRNNRNPFALPRVGDWFIQTALTLNQGASNNGTLAVGQFFLPGGTYDSVVFDVLTAGTTGSVSKVVAYDSDNGRPGKLLLDSATIDTTVTGQRQITVSLVIPAGGTLLWAGVVGQGAPTTTPALRRIASSVAPIVSTFTTPDLSYSPAVAFRLSDSITAAAPNTPTAVTQVEGSARLAFRRSA